MVSSPVTALPRLHSGLSSSQKSTFSAVIAGRHVTQPWGNLLRAPGSGFPLPIPSCEGVLMGHGVWGSSSYLETMRI